VIGAILGPLIFFLISNLIFYFKTGELRSSYFNWEVYQYIKSDFSAQYDIQITEEKIRSFGEPTIIVFANDKNVKNFCSKLVKNENLNLKPPIIKVYEKRSDLFFKIFPFFPPYKLVFEFSPELIGKEHLGGNDLFMSKNEILDLDNDGIKEIIVRMMTATCGSGAEVFNFIFTPYKNTYKLTATFPPAAYFKEFENISSSEIDKAFIKSIQKFAEDNEKPETLFPDQEILVNKKEKIEVNYTDSDVFFEFKDINNDKEFELVVAIPIWNISEQCFKNSNQFDLNPEQCECHWCPHRWKIGVYKYRNGDYNIDNNFNSGLLFTTSEKYTLYDIHGYKPLPNNFFGIISPYYGLGYLSVENEFLNFNFLERNTSKIWDIINAHYKH
jgi:hypothetical protein